MQAKVPVVAVKQEAQASSHATDYSQCSTSVLFEATDLL